MTQKFPVACLLLAFGCASQTTRTPALPEIALEYQEERRPCTHRTALRLPLFGDLHVHTSFSFDAGAYGNVLHPSDAYRFARGEAVGLPPLNAAGEPTRTAQIATPLDFLAVTDHGDLLGEVSLCTTPESEAFDTARCTAYRDNEGGGAFGFGVLMAALDPQRDPSICGEDGTRCIDAATRRWQDIKDAAEAAYDRSERCELTTFVGYEYTNTRAVSNLHRNVIFRNNKVPDRPITYYEAKRPLDLWSSLKTDCSDQAGCDVIVLPHNSNLSNGQLFIPDYPEANDSSEEAAIAALRVSMEPVVEMFQHKGDSECRNGFPGAPDDPHCQFEKLRAPDDAICPDNEPGAGGMRLTGCVHKLDFVRNVLLEGLKEADRLGVNPYRLGMIGSTDTHNGTPGHVTTDDFPGHVGIADDTGTERLGSGNITHDGIINNPGGLAGVWAVENSRDAIFEAMRRRETFATSGPRITPRFFGGWTYPDALCAVPDRVAHGYADGVPMGGDLPPAPPGESPVFMVSGLQGQAPRGAPIQEIEIIKGWVTQGGEAQVKVYSVAGSRAPEGSTQAGACEPPVDGTNDLCGVWRDPDFDANLRAFYYARILAAPTCRWSTLECLKMPVDERPADCGVPAEHRRVQQRAWTSPIWYTPPSSP